MQLWQKGQFKIVFEVGDNDPPASDELEIALRFNPGELAGVVSAVSSSEDAFKALGKLEEEIRSHLGILAPEVRDAIRNAAAMKVPGLAKALGWSVERLAKG